MGSVVGGGSLGWGGRLEGGGMGFSTLNFIESPACMRARGCASPWQEVRSSLPPRPMARGGTQNRLRTRWRLGPHPSPDL